MNKLTVFDNGGKTFDRYTVVINNDVYGMSVNADAPNGFNQYSGGVAENEAVLDALNGNLSALIGKEVLPIDLPKAVQLAIANRLRA